MLVRGNTDVHIAAVLARRDRACALRLDLLQNVFRQVLAHVRALWLRWESHGRNSADMLRNEPALALVPRREQLVRWRGADQTRMRHAREADAWDVPRGGVDA
jgi:hypothetical protein